MSLPIVFSWLRAWDFRRQTWDASLWQTEARQAVEDKSFATPIAFIRRALRLNTGLSANAAKYLLTFALLLFCNAVGNRLTFMHGDSAPAVTLGVVFGLATIHGIVYSCMFILSNGLVREQLSKAGAHDILTSAFHFHPLWLLGFSGETLRTKVVDTGLGAFSNVLNRFAWYGPMIVSLVAAVLTLWSLSVPLGVSLVVLATGVEMSLLGPMKEKAEADRRAACLARLRYAACEKLDYARLSSAQTRGPREYGAVVKRLVAYREHYARVTYPSDTASALAASLSCACNELVSLLLLWLLLTVPSAPDMSASGSQGSSSASQTGWLTWLFGRASKAPAATLSAFILAVRAVTKSLAKVLAQRKYTTDDLRQYATAAEILTTAFLPEDIAADATASAAVDVPALATRITAALGDRKAPVPITISTPGGAISIINSDAVRAVVVRPFELRAGDITFIRGINGSGKVNPNCRPRRSVTISSCFLLWRHNPMYSACWSLATLCNRLHAVAPHESSVRQVRRFDPPWRQVYQASIHGVRQRLSTCGRVGSVGLSCN